MEMAGPLASCTQGRQQQWHQPVNSRRGSTGVTHHALVSAMSNTTVTGTCAALQCRCISARER
jgi:hypothetical protein